MENPVQTASSTIQNQGMPKPSPNQNDLNKNENSMDIENNSQPIKQSYLPFATISEVTANSPAESSGILINDLIVEFGKTNIYNCDGLNGIANEVKNEFGKEIEVKVLREEGKGDIEHEGKAMALVTLCIVPKNWDGPGTLGCRFLKLN